MQERILRGDICLVDFGTNIGSVQGGTRPAVVLQNNVGNKFAPTVIVAPITSKLSKSRMPTHVYIPSGVGGLSIMSMVLTEQIQCIDKTQISRKLGFLPNDCMEAVDEAARISIAI